MGITIALVAFVILISLWSFLSKPGSEATKAVFNKPKVSLNIAILDDEQFKTLEPFDRIPLQYKYQARDKKGKLSQGLVSATSEEEAVKIVETGTGLTISSIEEVGVGRENPFVPYNNQTTTTTK